MAYTNETTHFGFPLPLGTDLTVPMDYNESLEAADTALYEAQTNASGAVGTAGNALTVANEAKTEAQSATATANSATATAQAAATAANEAVAAVAEAKDDALDMICAVVEETATAQYKHEPTKGGLNYYFRYNDILYKTTAVINVGETIVPNTNCSATNVATELEAGGASEVSAANVSYDNTTSGLAADDVQEAIDELANPTIVFGSPINLITQLASPTDFYTFEADGWVTVTPNNESTALFIKLYDSTAADTSANSAVIGGYVGDIHTTFVKKGMKASRSSTNGSAVFLPIS